MIRSGVIIETKADAMFWIMMKNFPPCLLNPKNPLMSSYILLQNYIDKNISNFSGLMLMSITVQIVLAIMQIHSNYCIHQTVCKEKIVVCEETGELFLLTTSTDLWRYRFNPNSQEIIAQDYLRIMRELDFLRRIPLTDDSFDVQLVFEEFQKPSEFPAITILQKILQIGSDKIAELMIRRFGTPWNIQASSFLEELKTISNPIVVTPKGFLTFGGTVNLSGLMSGSLDMALCSLDDFLLNHRREGTEPKLVLQQYSEENLSHWKVFQSLSSFEDFKQTVRTSLENPDALSFFEVVIEGMEA